MNQKGGFCRLQNACRKGDLQRIIANYIKGCSAENSKGSDGVKGKKCAKSGDIFPNLAGFCRYMNIGTEELFALAKEFPTEIDRLMTILEDEALNSGLPPALLSVYLKKRLCYERDGDRASHDTSLNIRFEHDIFRDGE